MIVSVPMFVHRGTKWSALSKEMNTLVQTEKKLDELINSCRWQVQQMNQNTYSQRYPLTHSREISYKNSLLTFLGY